MENNMDFNILSQIIDYMSGKCEDPVGGNEGVTEYDETNTLPDELFQSETNKDESN